MMRSFKTFLAEARGTAAVALWAVAILVPLANVTDVGFYIYRKMQVEIAAQAAANAAWNFCNTTAKLPAAQNCTGLQTQLTTVAQTSTSLAANITLNSTATTDGYYCVKTTVTPNQLTFVPIGSSPVTVASGSAPPAAPATCTTVVSGSVSKPGEYIRVSVQYTFTPVFTAASVTSLLPATITKTAWIRLK